MILRKKIKFLNQCKNNLDKLNFYLDMSNSDISCGPCLVIKRYYEWSLKFIFKVEDESVNKEVFFKRIVEKLDYKVIANMEYEDIRNITSAYYSLGEIYLQQGKLDIAKEYFTKVISVMEEFLKVGNRFQTQEVQEKNGIVVFEILMWARKSLADMLEIEEALSLYDSIIAEEELLYLQKYYAIYNVCKLTNQVERVNEAIRAMLKICPDYEDVNKDAVEYLTSVGDYSDALDIAKDEYAREGISHWINAVNNICVLAEELDEACVEKIMEFSNLLMADLKVVEWSTIMLSLYRCIRSLENQSIQVMEYLRGWFNKVDYENKDFVNCGDAILVLNDVYEDIRIGKYGKLYLRQYEFDFTFFLMNIAVQNESYEKGIEATSKLEAIVEACKENKGLYEYITKCQETCIKKLQREEYDLGNYPWYYLYKEMDSICEDYGVEDEISWTAKLRNSLDKMIVGINIVENKRLEEILNSMCGEKIFREDKDIVFIGNETVNIDEKLEKNHKFQVINKEGLLRDNDSILITTKESRLLEVADKNVILVNGHEELRDMEITYIKHMLGSGENINVILVVNKKDEEYSLETLNYNKVVIEKLVGCNEELQVVDLSQYRKPMDVLGVIIGEKSNNIMIDKFHSFKGSIDNMLVSIDEDMKSKNDIYKKKRYTLSEAKEEYDNLMEDVDSNYKEFLSKIKGDIEFLAGYAEDKITIMIPDVIEKKFNAIDDLEEASKLKENAEKIFSEAVVEWCNKNVYDMLLEQFEVCISKYTKLYSYHQETVEKLYENRNKVMEAYPEFEEKINVIIKKAVEDLIKEFLDYYDESLKEIDYEVKVIPSEKFINSVTNGIKVMFMKSEEKAESARVKIKNQVIENKENIKENLGGNIRSKLNELSSKLEDNIRNIFEDVKKEISLDKSKVEENIVAMDKNNKETIARNEKINCTINLLKVELLKYNKQVDENIVYYKNKCYKLD